VGIADAATTLLAAQPPIAPPISVDARIGQAGQWFGPAVLFAIAILIDATAAGKEAKRDRAGALLTYTATLGFISIYGWSKAIQGWFSWSWSWQLTGSAISLLAHLALIAVLFGDFAKKQESTLKRLNGWLGPKIGIGSEDSKAVGRINTKLHLWAAATAMTFVLGRGDIVFIQSTIGSITTGAGAAVVNFTIGRLGG
jgi:hypothetical protein